MRSYLTFFLVALAALLLWWIYPQLTGSVAKDSSASSDSRDGELSHTKGANPSLRTSPTRPPSFPKHTTPLPAASGTDLLHSPNTTPQDDLSLLHTLLWSHRSSLGENPVGLNDEITAALTGRNIKGAASLPADHPAISEKGELLDRWKIPYRFHAFSGKLMEIRSAGPDRQFFTADDVLLRE